MSIGDAFIEALSLYVRHLRYCEVSGGSSVVINKSGRQRPGRCTCGLNRELKRIGKRPLKED